MCLHQPIPQPGPCDTCKSKQRDLLDLDLARHSLEHLTIARVVNYLTYVFDAAEDEILCMGNVCATPSDLLDVFHPGKLACVTEITFWGGPPEEEEWYKGTLLTMLIDRLFYNIAVGNERIVDRFLETLNG
jgi:hypothetical protein